MAITTAGSLRLEPYRQATPADPLGSLIGTASSAGDASGGNHTITWDLPNTFFYVLRTVGANSNLITGQPVEFHVTTGVVLDNVSEVYVEVNDGVTGVTNFSAIMKEPSFLWRPPAASSPSIKTFTANVGVGKVFNGACRLMIWPSDVLQVVPIEFMAKYLP